MISSFAEGAVSFTVKVEVQRLHWDIDPIVRCEHGKVLLEEAANLKLPSLNLLPQLHGVIVPSFIFCIRTTEFRIPGTAAEARSALQITQSGAVI